MLLLLVSHLSARDPELEVLELWLTSIVRHRVDTVIPSSQHLADSSGRNCLTAQLPSFLSGTLFILRLSLLSQ